MYIQVDWVSICYRDSYQIGSHILRSFYVFTHPPHTLVFCFKDQKFVPPPPPNGNKWRFFPSYSVHIVFQYFRTELSSELQNSWVL